MCLGGAWYTVTFEPAETLDVDLLEREVLTPILGISDVRTDARIGFVGGIRGNGGAGAVGRRRRVRRGVLLYPVSTADLMRIADAGGIMPPKSTWFEPKLRDGLLSHLIS